MDIIVCLLIIILSCILISYIFDDYSVYRRLNNTADDLINNADMTDLCKLENLSWLHENCVNRAECSIFFRNHYLSIANKIDEFIILKNKD